LLFRGIPSQSYGASPAVWRLQCSVASHPTHVNMPRLNPCSQADRCSIYLSRTNGRLSRPGWLVTYRDSLPAFVVYPASVQPMRITVTLLRHYWVVIIYYHWLNHW